MTDRRVDEHPDRWMIVKIIEHHNDAKTHYRVFATWGGSYLNGGSWKMNSGIVSVDEDDKYFYFNGASGSVYACHKSDGAYGAFSYGLSVLHDMMKQAMGLIEVVEMPEHTNWKGLKYE